MFVGSASNPHPLSISYYPEACPPPTRKRGEKARIARCRLVGVVTRTFRPLANLRPRRCFPVSASPPDRLSPLFDEKIRPTPRVIRHIGFPPTALSLSLFPSLFSRDEVIDIFHEKNRRKWMYAENTLPTIGLFNVSKGRKFRSSADLTPVLYFRYMRFISWKESLSKFSNLNEAFEKVLKQIRLLYLLF